MGFLIRTAFWFSLVLLFLPLDTGAGADARPAVGPIDAFFAAREAVGDIAGMCERKPEVCETGRSAFGTITARAGEGARLAYRLIEDEAPATEMAAGAPDAMLSTGSVPAAD